VPTTQSRMFQRRRTAAQWAAENPVLGEGEFGFAKDTGILKIGDGVTAFNTLVGINVIAELAAFEPAEVDLVTVAETTTLTLLDTVARNAMKHVAGQYYFSHYTSVSAQILADGVMVLCPTWLSKGTIDRIGVDVSTAAAASVIRLGIYTDNAGLPNALIAEATTTADSTTTGIKDLTISAVIPTNGRYWMAGVAQGSAAVAINAVGNIGNNPVPLPLGTTAVGGTTSLFSRTRASTAGALPANATGLNANPQGTRFRWHFRYA
jgi:Major tropism determinant N-terminal domain